MLPALTCWHGLRTSARRAARPYSRGGRANDRPCRRVRAAMPNLRRPAPWRRLHAADQDAGFATVRRDHRLIVELNPDDRGAVSERADWLDLHGLPIRDAEREARRAPAGSRDAAGAADGVGDPEWASAGDHRGAGEPAERAGQGEEAEEREYPGHGQSAGYAQPRVPGGRPRPDRGARSAGLGRHATVAISGQPTRASDCPASAHLHARPWELGGAIRASKDLVDMAPISANVAGERPATLVGTALNACRALHPRTARCAGRLCQPM